MKRATVDTQQLAVGSYGRCRPTAASETGDLWTAVHCEDVATSGAMVDAMQEHRRQNLTVLRRAAATVVSTAINTDYV